MANDDSSSNFLPRTNKPANTPASTKDKTAKGRGPGGAGQGAGAQRPSASAPVLVGVHEYGPEWLRSEPAALMAVGQALAQRDDKTLAALYRQERDPSAFLERLRHCAGVLVRPWAMRPLLDSRPDIYERNHVWLMPIITPVGRHLPPFIPDPAWLRDIQACLQDWMGPKVNLAMLQGVAGWGDLSKLSPARWRHIVDSLADAAGGEGQGPGIHATAQAIETPSDTNHPHLSFLVGVVRREGPSPRIPGANDPRSAQIRSRLDGLIQWVSTDRQQPGPAPSGPDHRFALPLPFTQAFGVALEMWMQEVEGAFHILAWDLYPKRFMSLSLVLQIRSRQDAGMEMRLEMGMLRWQVGEGSVQRLQEQLKSYPRVHGLAQAPNEKGVPQGRGRPPQ